VFHGPVVGRIVSVTGPRVVVDEVRLGGEDGSEYGEAKRRPEDINQTFH
jgi:hypothetical protein